MRPPTVMPPPLTASPRIGRQRTRGLLPRRRRRRRPTIRSAAAFRRRRRRRQKRTRLEAASRWRAPPSPRRRPHITSNVATAPRSRAAASECGPLPTRSRRRRSRSTRRPTSWPISSDKRWEGRWSSCSVGRAAAAATRRLRHPKRGGCAGTRAGRWRRSGSALRSSFCRRRTAGCRRPWQTRNGRNGGRRNGRRSRSPCSDSSARGAPTGRRSRPRRPTTPALRSSPWSPPPRLAPPRRAAPAAPLTRTTAAATAAGRRCSGGCGKRRTPNSSRRSRRRTRRCARPVASSSSLDTWRSPRPRCASPLWTLCCCVRRRRRSARRSPPTPPPSPPPRLASSRGSRLRRSTAWRCEAFSLAPTTATARATARARTAAAAVRSPTCCRCGGFSSSCGPTAPPPPPTRPPPLPRSTRGLPPRRRRRRARRRRRRRRGERGRRRRRDGGAGGGGRRRCRRGHELRQRTDTPGGERPEAALQFCKRQAALVFSAAYGQASVPFATPPPQETLDALHRLLWRLGASPRPLAPDRLTRLANDATARCVSLGLSAAATVAADAPPAWPSPLGALLYEATSNSASISAAAAAEGAAADADAATADAAAAAAHLAALGGFGGWLGARRCSKRWLAWRCGGGCSRR